MVRMQQGEQEGLLIVYENYKTYLYSVVYSVIQDRQIAEDLTADCFLHIWKAADQYRPGGTHRAYLASIARNLTLDYLRKQHREETIAEMLGQGPEKEWNPSAEEEVISVLSVKEMLARIPMPDREILALKIEGGLTFREIADILAIPMGTVTWKYRRAVEILRRRAI